MSSLLILVKKMDKDLQNYFRGKKVTVMGLGLLGRGLGDAIFLAEQGAELTITDLRDEKTLAPSLEKLKKYQNIKYTLGEHKFEDFEDKDFILKAAGVPLESSYIAHAKEKGIPIEMDSSLFYKLLPEGVNIVGVTGTRGKSTTTHLIYHILKTAGKKVFLGGNVRDMATLPLIKEVKSEDYVVLELDSWQLQGFGEAKINPHVSVFTTFMPDHLNYYHNNLDLYFADKANIFKYQTEKDFLVVGEDIVSKIGDHKSKMIIAERKNVSLDWKIKIPGEHNKLNIACAVEAVKVLGIDENIIKEGVESFDGVEGRLQFVKEIHGVKIWNDNNATTPDAAIAALKALGGNIILIMGGADKKLDTAELLKDIPKYCKKTILIPGSGTENLNLKDGIKTNNLEDALKESVKFAEFGDNILFSPAFASFGQFNNEYERNDEFLRIVGNL